MTVPAPERRPGSSPVPTPASGHRDAQWYRRHATKASADPVEQHPSRLSDDAAWASVSHLTAGILVYGGLGWLIGRWLGHPDLFAAAGVLLGVGLALFMLFRRLEPPRPETPETPRTGPQPDHRTEDVEPMPDLSGPTSKEPTS